MKPGPKLDRLVHKHVFDLCAHDWQEGSLKLFEGPGGLKVTRCTQCGKNVTDTGWEPTPPYSTDIAAAWTVVGEMFKDCGFAVNLQRDLDGQWIVHRERWTKNTDTLRIWDITMPLPSFKCPTAPHAICIAAISFWVDEELLEEWGYDGIEDDIRSYEEEPS